MSKRCPDCGFVNDDSRIYCSSCGELLDPELRLIKNLENKGAKKPSSGAPYPKEEPAPPKKPEDDNYVPPKSAKDKGPGIVPWIILGAVAVVVAVVLVLML